jgi:hypothetical protein
MKKALEAAQELEILTGLKPTNRAATMIDKILEFAIRQRVLVLMGALALLLGGIWSAKTADGRDSRFNTGVQVQINTTIHRCAGRSGEPGDVSARNRAWLVYVTERCAVALRAIANHTPIQRSEIIAHANSSPSDYKRG